VLARPILFCVGPCFGLLFLGCARAGPKSPTHIPGTSGYYTRLLLPRTTRSRPYEDDGSSRTQRQRHRLRQAADAGVAPGAVQVSVASEALQHVVEVAPEARAAAPAGEREADVGGGGAVVEAEAGHDAVDAAQHEVRLCQARPAAEGVHRPRRHVQRALGAQPERALAPAVDPGIIWHAVSQ
jgi:hypothetical protein